MACFGSTIAMFGIIIILDSLCSDPYQNVPTLESQIKKARKRFNPLGESKSKGMM